MVKPDETQEDILIDCTQLDETSAYWYCCDVVGPEDTDEDLAEVQHELEV